MSNNTSQQQCRCRRCNRTLKNDKHKAVGYGPVCLKKMGLTARLLTAPTPVVEDPNQIMLSL